LIIIEGNNRYLLHAKTGFAPKVQKVAEFRSRRDSLGAKWKKIAKNYIIILVINV
jgi:hypothetical protein